MNEAGQRFSIIAVDWEYRPTPELGQGRRPGRPVRVGPKVIVVHCHQCGADLTLTKSPAGPAPGFFYLVPGFIYIGCPECSAERTVPVGVLEEMKTEP